MLRTPTIRELLEDRIFRKYMKTAPHLPEPLRWGQPWKIWGLTTAGKWRTASYTTYRDAWLMVVKMVRDTDHYKDACLVSRRYFYEEPEGFNTSSFGLDLEWCGRCRRPTHFHFLTSGHHAVRNATLTDDEPFRCVYCGVRRTAWQPS